MPYSTQAIGSGAEARGAFCAVNAHCLERIVRLAPESEVVASRDIVDHSGVLLLACGATLSRASQSLLERRVLQIPLEASLEVAGGVSLATIVDDCFRLMSQTPALALLGGADGAQQALRALSATPLDGALKLLLSVSRSTARGNYAKALAAMIVCAGLAHGLGLNANGSAQLILSALVQDVGESYIDPDLLAARTPLPIGQWPLIAVHPLVAGSFLTAFTDLPPALAECVVQHHERQDGSGYPLARRAATMTAPGALSGLADCVAALVMGGALGGDSAREAPAYSSLSERVAIALNIVADEFPPPAVAVVKQALAALAARGEGIVGGSFARLILPTLQQVRSARLLADALAREARGAELGSRAEFACSTILRLDKRLRATGVYDIAQLGLIEIDPRRMGQTCLVLDEVRWRLRQLARNVYLRTVQGGSAADLAQLAELVAALAGPG